MEEGGGPRIPVAMGTLSGNCKPRRQEGGEASHVAKQDGYQSLKAEAGEGGSSAVRKGATRRSARQQLSAAPEVFPLRASRDLAQPLPTPTFPDAFPLASSKGLGRSRR